jgi:DNA mismatch endonuclease (patch repair protein)
VRLAVFVDGCYWHGCSEHRSIPATNRTFWRAKIEGTRQRDEKQDRWLETAGWTVLRFWEHEPVEEAAERVMETVIELRRRVALDDRPEGITDGARRRDSSSLKQQP